MVVTIIIIAYVANVFLNRWLNKIYWKQDNTNAIAPLCWFLGLFDTAALLIMIVEGKTRSNWFTGKHW